MEQRLAARTRFHTRALDNDLPMPCLREIKEENLPMPNGLLQKSSLLPPQLKIYPEVKPYQLWQADLLKHRKIKKPAKGKSIFAPIKAIQPMESPALTFLVFDHPIYPPGRTKVEIKGNGSQMWKVDEWLYKAIRHFKLSHDTRSTSMSVVHKFYKSQIQNSFTPKQFQLQAIAILLLCTKLHEPSTKNLFNLITSACQVSKAEVIAMEMVILEAIQFWVPVKIIIGLDRFDDFIE